MPALAVVSGDGHTLYTAIQVHIDQIPVGERELVKIMDKFTSFEGRGRKEVFTRVYSFDMVVVSEDGCRVLTRVPKEPVVSV